MPVFYCAITDAVAPHCVRGRRDCGFECCGVCLHVGTRHRICYTLVIRCARAFTEADNKRDCDDIRNEERAITNSSGEQYFFIQSYYNKKKFIVGLILSFI